MESDYGVAIGGSPVCQNFEVHDEEVEMQSGPHDGWICPECGRATTGEVQYVDPDGETGKHPVEVSADVFDATVQILKEIERLLSSSAAYTKAEKIEQRRKQLEAERYDE